MNNVYKTAEKVQNNINGNEMKTVLEKQLFRRLYPEKMGEPIGKIEVLIEIELLTM